MAATTWIKNADWVVAWDPETGGHEYIRHGDVVFSGNAVTFVGKDYRGGADTVVDGTDRMVMPGLMNLHVHCFHELHFKGFFEDLASKHLWMSHLYEHCFLITWDDESARAATETALCEMLKSGCTTVAELTLCPLPYPDLIDTMSKSGIRGYVCPMVRSGEWYSPDGNDVLYRWFDEELDETRLSSGSFDDSLAIIDEAEGDSSGRLTGMLGPMQVDTCTEELLRKCKRAADARGIPMQTHASQSVVEFREMVRRHRKTPIEWMHDIGVLGPNSLIGHGINIDQHPWVDYHEHKDLERLAETGSSVIHCQRVFARWGNMMHSLGGYRAAGVNMALGTDSYPHNLIEEMRIAGLISKVASGHVDLLKTQDVFEVATLGAARALGRDDLGRISVGAKADIVLVDLKHPTMRPVRDPLKCLIYSGTADAVRDVYVDGNLVVEDRQVLTLDHDDALDRLQAGQNRSMDRIPSVDWAHRTADEIAPLSWPVDRSTPAG